MISQAKIWSKKTLLKCNIYSIVVLRSILCLVYSRRLYLRTKEYFHVVIVLVEQLPLQILTWQPWRG